MKHGRYIFILIITLSIASALQKWNYEDVSERIGQNHKMFRQYPDLYTNPKMTSIKEREMMLDIIEKLENKDANITEILADLEEIVKKSPNTPKNFNFSLAIQQIEDTVRENVTKTLYQKIRSKDFPTVDKAEIMRYKRDNASYNNCVNIVTIVGRVVGGVAGAGAGGGIFSALSPIGTVLGIALGAFLGQLLGKIIGAAIGKAACPK